LNTYSTSLPPNAATEFQTVVNDLLPTSSEDDSGSPSASTEKQHKRRRKEEVSFGEKKGSHKKNKHKRTKSRHKSDKHGAAEREFELHVAAELAGGAERRLPQVRAWAGDTGGVPARCGRRRGRVGEGGGGARVFHPNSLWLTGEGNVDEFYRNLNTDQEAGQAFLCHGSSCESPMTSITELTKTISQRPDVTD